MDLLYASYDEWAYCMAVMMSGPIVASYDEWAYSMAVMMSRSIVWQL